MISRRGQMGNAGKGFNAGRPLECRSQMTLFGSSGIRGVVGRDFTADLALRIGLAVGSEHPRMVVGNDPRTSGDMVRSALVAGATAAGAQVALAGMVPTPTLARATKGFDCGLMVTASHNPAEYNGVKMWNPDGSAFDTEQMQRIEDRLDDSDFDRKDWMGVGSTYPLEGAVERHIEAVLASVEGSRSKVVLDCGCGAASLVSPYVLRGMGCDLVTINCQPDGHFPGRGPEPTEDELQDLKNMVVSRGAHMGIAHDGDGDRMVAVDRRGRMVDGDKLLALFAYIAQAGDVVAPVDASMVLDDIVKGRVIRTRVGDVYVAEALKKHGAGFGGEPSGTYIFPSQTYCPDGILAAAILVSMVGDGDLAEMVDALPSYPVARRSYPFPPEKRREVESRLLEEMTSLDCDELTQVDGFRAQFANGWILLRLSGTEPKLRIAAEARSQEELGRMISLAEDVARGCIR